MGINMYVRTYYHAEPKKTETGIPGHPQAQQYTIDRIRTGLRSQE